MLELCGKVAVASRLYIGLLCVWSVQCVRVPVPTSCGGVNRRAKNCVRRSKFMFMRKCSAAMLVSMWWMKQAAPNVALQLSPTLTPHPLPACFAPRGLCVSCDAVTLRWSYAS